MSDISVRDFLEELAHERPSVFAQYYRRLKGKRLRYTYPNNLYAWRHFLVQPMDDFHSDKVIKKARQLGASECHLNEVFWFLTEHDYTNTIYTFPRGPKDERIFSDPSRTCYSRVSLFRFPQPCEATECYS